MLRDVARRRSVVNALATSCRLLPLTLPLCGSLTLPACVGLSGELNSIARLASRSTKIMPADTSPSPPFRGEREGPDPQGWEGEVGGATNRLVGPPHPTLSPRPAGGEGKGRVVRATLRRQIFEKPVLTLSPDSPAACGERDGVRGSTHGIGSQQHRQRIFDELLEGTEELRTDRAVDGPVIA